MRVYLPADRAGLEHLRDAGSLPATSGAIAPTAAVVARLGRVLAAPERDEREYAAFSAAVSLAGTLPSAAQGPVVVVAADVDVADVTDPDAAGPGRVRLRGEVPRARIAAFHVEDVATRSADGAPDPLEFLWYDVTELGDVLDALS